MATAARVLGVLLSLAALAYPADPSPPPTAAQALAARLMAASAAQCKEMLSRGEFASVEVARADAGGGGAPP
jgi:hypothetical protein